MMVLYACEKDYQSSGNVDINTLVSYSKDINPIFTEDCATPNCHITGGQVPNLIAAESYNELLNLGYVDTLNPEASILYQRLISTTKPMPPSGKLNPEEIGYVLAWIKQGAQNN